MRQIYVDLVRARARVRVVSAAEHPAGSKPIFIIGIYRSGTTLLRYVIDSHPRLACPPESNFLNKLGELLNDHRALDGLASMGFDRPHVASQLRGMATYFYANYAASCNKPRWVDKTPMYVDCLATIEEIFPGSQYIVIHRNPLDQIHSHTKGGTFIHEPIAELVAQHGNVQVGASHYWLQETKKILEFCNRVPPAVVVKYEDLCQHPRETMKRVLVAIGEPWSDEVLSPYGHQHDQGMEAAGIQRFKGFDLQTGGYSQWDEGVRRTCSTLVRDTARAVGYQV